jgi:hypothetical protein
MKLLASLVATLSIFTQAASAAEQACPTFTPGMPYPWETKEIVPGDQWAWVYLLIDKNGRAKDCRIGEGTIHDKDRRGIICMSFVKNWYVKPILKDGQPVEGWFRRYFLLEGTKHAGRDVEARKLFFQQHAEERPECYPEYTR